MLYVVLGTSTNDLLPVPFSIIGNEEQMSSYELHIAVKDHCAFTDDRLIGVSVMQLKDIQDQVRQRFRQPLGERKRGKKELAKKRSSSIRKTGGGQR